MSYFKKLLGDRIYLSPRSSSLEEVEQFTRWLNDFDITDYVGKSNQVITFSGEKEWLDKAVSKPGAQAFFIVELATDKLIGVISLENFDYTSRNATLGIFIGEKDYHSKGYGTEAINLILEYGFKYLNLHSIKLDLVSANERAHKSYLKCGFKDTGYTRDNIFINGKYYDKLHMDILENEFTGEYIRNKNL